MTSGLTYAFVWERLRDGSQLGMIYGCDMFHSETIRDDLGYTFTRIKTNGRKLEKVILESLFSTVPAGAKNGQRAGIYIFETKANSTAKAPMGAFETEEIPNDLSSGSIKRILGGFTYMKPLTTGTE